MSKLVFEVKRVLLHKTLLLLLAFVCVYGTILFNKYEPTLWPVVKDFTITRAWVTSNAVYIRGTMDKERNCEFIGASAYDMSGNIPELIQMTFMETPNGDVSRLLGIQKFGPWEIIPRTGTLKLVVEHQCNTGRVFTTLFNGALVEVANHE